MTKNLIKKFDSHKVKKIGTFHDLFRQIIPVFPGFSRTNFVLTLKTTENCMKNDKENLQGCGNKNTYLRKIKDIMQYQKTCRIAGLTTYKK